MVGGNRLLEQPKTLKREACTLQQHLETLRCSQRTLSNEQQRGDQNDELCSHVQIEVEHYRCWIQMVGGQGESNDLPSRKQSHVHPRQEDAEVARSQLHCRLPCPSTACATED